MTEQISINEIFFSLQGESTYVGEPCAFIRLAGCDLRCSWCDTEYAFFEGRRMAIEQIVKEVERFPTRLVEITGGEPLLQRPVFVLMSVLADKGWKVLVETGGHRDITPVDPRVVLIYDIKCPDSGMVDRNRWENVGKLRPHDQVKFVIASRGDFDWAAAVLGEHRLAERHVVLFSPVWDSVTPTQLANWILTEGLPVRMQLQLHKLLWGPEARGV